eukprot:1177478-Prorocentrum_minimum.AAC.4
MSSEVERVIAFPNLGHMYPRNFLAGDDLHRPPFPLAIFSSGFLVESKQYLGYAERLASWGYVVLTYDKIENINSVRNDVVSACDHECSEESVQSQLGPKLPMVRSFGFASYSTIGQSTHSVSYLVSVITAMYAGGVEGVSLTSGVICARQSRTRPGESIVGSVRGMI